MIPPQGNPRKEPARSSLHAALRITISILLQVTMFRLVGGVEGNSYDSSTGLNMFLFAFLPTASVLVVAPVLLRGALAEIIVAVLLTLLGAWFAFMGWASVIGVLFK